MSAGSAFTPNIGKDFQRLRVRHTEPNGTDGGGGSSVNVWHTRTLNTVDLNEIPGASISGSALTLPAGTYKLDALFTVVYCNYCQHRLWRTSGTPGLIMEGFSSASTQGTGFAQPVAPVRGVFTLTETTTMEFQLLYNASYSNPFGIQSTASQSNNTQDEVYAEVLIEREIPAINDGNGELVRGPMCHFSDYKGETAAGGALTANTWNTRTLNTDLQVGIVGASRSGNVVTLPAGDYEVEVSAPAHRPASHAVRFRNTSDNTTAALSSTEHSDTGNFVTTTARGLGRFSIAGPKSFEVQHYINSAVAGSESGGIYLEASTGSGESSVYAEVRIWKLVRAGVQETDPSTKPLVHLTEEQPSGTSGGTPSTNVWNTRTLNTIRTNEVGASLSLGRVTLPAGTYYCEGWGVGRRAGAMKAAIYNFTDSTFILDGTTTYCDPTNSDEMPKVKGRFTLLASKQIELQQFFQTANSGTGLGNGYATPGRPEVFAELLIWKLD